VIKLMDENSIETFPIEIEALQRMGTMPIPGEPIDVSQGVSLRDGLIVLKGSRRLQGKSIEVTDMSLAKNRPDPIPPPLIPALSPTGGSIIIASKVADLAHEAVRGAKTDFEKASAIRDVVSSRITYNINAPATPDGRDPIEFALFDSKQGYCDVFASSVVVMCREVGVPARYVTGFLPDYDARLEEGSFIVREKDAHAWAEVLIDKVGWVILDATAGADSVEGAGVGAASDDVPWYRKPWVLPALNWLILATVLGGIIAYIGGKVHRKRHPNYRSDLDQVYLRFVGVLNKVGGTRRQPGMTSREYVQVTSAKLGTGSDSASEISEAFDAAYYSSAGVSQETVQGLSEKVEDFRRLLRSRPEK
jgi:hypothetical protein